MKQPFVAVLLLGFVTAATAAPNPPCTAAEGRRALDEADTLRSWDTLYKSYRSYRQCDDGAIAEGYSESVARILVGHWDELPRLAEVTARSAPFRRFVLLHVDSTLDTNDLRTISRNARTKCPSELRTTCADLEKKASAAIAGQAALGIK